MEDKQIQSVIEALLFVSEKPLTVDKICEVFENQEENSKIKRNLDELVLDYKNNSQSLCISKVAGGYQMTTRPELAVWLRNLYKSEKIEKLSSPAVETLAIIAYKQPLTRLEIEEIRGVNSEGVLKTLMEKGLIRIGGRKETIGRPIIYNTSRLFLEYFGLSSLKDLPSIGEGEGEGEKELELIKQKKESEENS